MRFEVITIFPELFASFLQKGLVAKAHENGLIHVRCTNIRDFAKNKHHSVDDAPYGGGSGMVMMPGPVLEALESVETEGRVHRVLLTPQGKRFDQATARRLATYPAVALVCGRYEGIDERACEEMDEQISLGDFVMTGGEVAAMAVIEATARLLPGVLGNEASTQDESHAHGLLEYPQYTRPPEFRGRGVPDVLLSGDHAAIERFRRKEALRRTRAWRPDLLEKAVLEARDRALLEELLGEKHASGPLPNPLPEGEGTRDAARGTAKGTGTELSVASLPEGPGETARGTAKGTGTGTELSVSSSSGRELGRGTAPVYVGLVHYPVRDREGNVVTTAVTNLDVHDISRSSRTYGLAGYFVITPIEAQQALVHKICEHWVEGSGKRRVPERGVALSLCTPIASIEEAVAAITARWGEAPRIAVTAAKLPGGITPTPSHEVGAQMRSSPRPWLLLFGTGHGLATEVLERAEVALPPIRPGSYNHLSVRAACAIILDRVFGDSGAS